MFTFVAALGIIEHRKDASTFLKGALAMCTKSDLNVLLQKIAEAYLNVYGETVVKIILYGSYARGTNDEQSDVDVVAIVDGERPELQKKLRKVWDIVNDLELRYETVLSPTVIPYEEFQQFKEIIPYYRNIEKEGVEIVA